MKLGVAAEAVWANAETGVSNAATAATAKIRLMAMSWMYLAAVATLLNKQKPMALSFSAWWPGGRTAAIEVRQTLGEVEREFRRAVRESIISRAVILLLFVLSMVGLTRWNIGRPIRLLMAGARAINAGRCPRW